MHFSLKKKKVAKNSQRQHGVLCGLLQFDLTSVTMGTQNCELLYSKLWVTVWRTHSMQKFHSKMTPRSLCTKFLLTEITYAAVSISPVTLVCWNPTPKRCYSTCIAIFAKDHVWWHGKDCVLIWAEMPTSESLNVQQVHVHYSWDLQDEDALSWAVFELKPKLFHHICLEATHQPSPAPLTTVCAQWPWPCHCKSGTTVSDSLMFTTEASYLFSLFSCRSIAHLPSNYLYARQTSAARQRCVHSTNVLCGAKGFSCSVYNWPKLQCTLYLFLSQDNTSV